MHQTGIKLSGLSIKIMKGTDTEVDLCRDDVFIGRYFFDNRFKIGKHASIMEDVLIKYLRDIKSRIPFGRIIFDGYYPLSGKELMDILNEKK